MKRDGRQSEKGGASGDGDPFDPLSDLARAWAASGPESTGGAAAWAALEAGLGRQLRRRSRRRVLVAAAAVVALALGWRATWNALHRDRLTFAVEGAAARSDGYIPRVQQAEAEVKFSDGTRVGLERGSRAWVIDTGADGARLRLEDGRAHFAVVHRPRAHWSVEAGPFVVSVTGTKFDVEWSGARDLLRVYLLSGVVTVGGPQTRGGVTLLPGQVLEARPDEGILRVEPAPAPTALGSAPAGSATAPTAEPGSPVAPAAPAAATPAASAAAAQPPIAAAAGEPRAASRRAAPAASRRSSIALAARPAATNDLGADWSQRIGQGAFASILDEASAAGIDGCVRTLPSDRLAALADAARYAGKPELARRVLSAQRQRFAGSAAAAEAAFLLGRVAEDTHEPGRAALVWYERYLDEAPSGTYAAEALGRAMLILSLGPNELRAREIARRYLERYPRGAYAVQARELLEDNR